MEKIKIYAKANLSLKVVGHSLCMHELDMIVGSCLHIFDTVWLQPLPNKQVIFECDNISIAKENTATRMCEGFIRRFNVGGARIILKKGIPFEGGLGGSSAAAAGVCLLMQKIYGKQDSEQIKELCMEVGSDVYYMMTGGFARLRGYGEIIESFDAKPLHAVISKPQNGVNTRECFRLFDENSSSEEIDNNSLKDAIINRDFNKIKSGMKNHLQDSAIRLNGDIKAILDMSEISVMSGSGSSVVSIYQTEKEAKLQANRLPNGIYTKIF